MLRVNVGLSRKLSKDYNSTGYSVNIDGEVTASTSDPEAVMVQVKELFDLAEEALSFQIDRAQSNEAIASRDEEHNPRNDFDDRRQPKFNGNGDRDRHPVPNGNGTQRTNPRQVDQPATNKQINYLLNLGKRQRLSVPQLEKKVGEILGQAVGLYDLTKQAAATAIDQLANGVATGPASSRF